MENEPQQPLGPLDEALEWDDFAQAVTLPVPVRCQHVVLQLVTDATAHVERLICTQCGLATALRFADLAADSQEQLDALLAQAGRVFTWSRGPRGRRLAARVADIYEK